MQEAVDVASAADRISAHGRQLFEAARIVPPTLRRHLGKQLGGLRPYTSERDQCSGRSTPAYHPVGNAATIRQAIAL
jgi:hypothetical protein